MKENEIAIAKEEFGYFCKIWEKSSFNGRVSLVNDFIFNPNTFQTRINTEKNFQKKLDTHWKK